MTAFEPRFARVLKLFVTIGCIGGAAGCESEPGEDGFSEPELAKVRTFGPLPSLPSQPMNRYADDPAAAAFGQRLFFERAYSGALQVGDDGSNGGLGPVGETGKVSCASCHDPSAYYIDTRTKPNNVSLGVGYGER